MSVEETIEAGRRAERLLEDEVFQSVLTEMRDGIAARWRSTIAVQTDVREALFREISQLDAFEAVLRNRVSNAKLEAVRLGKRSATKP